MREVEASVGQRLLWLLDHYRGGNGMINVPVAWRIHGNLDLAALHAAYCELLARHEALRTTYTARGRRLFQVVNDMHSQEIAFADLSGEPDAALAALNAMEVEMRSEIDPRLWPVRASLWRIGERDHLLLVNIHHLATDFFSNTILTRDLSWLYDNITGAGAGELPPVIWSYSDWSEWQRHAFAEGRLEKLQTYWKNQLDGAQLPSIPRGASASPAASEAAALDAPGRATFDLDPAIVERLQHVARDLRTTLFPVMLAAFYAHLYHRSAQRDLSVASLLTNRTRPEVQETIGFFVNMIVLRVQVDSDAPLAQIVRRSRQAFVEAIRHGELPLQLLPAHTITSADEVIFQYLDTPVSRESTLDFEVLDMPVAVEAGRFVLELVVFNREHFMLRHNSQFSKEWARGFLADYTDVLTRLAEEPGLPLASIVLS